MMALKCSFLYHSKPSIADFFLHFLFKEWLLFLLLSLASILSFCGHGYFQEKLTIQKQNTFQEEMLFMLITASMNACMSSILLWSLQYLFPTKQSLYVPTYIYLVIACSGTFSAYAGICSLRYITYPMKVLGKSCKPIVLMIAGRLMIRRIYSFRQYCSIVLIVFGVSLFFMSSSSKKKMQNHTMVSYWKGISLLLISLIFDAITGTLEDKYIKRYAIHPMILLRNMSLWSFLMAALCLQIAFILQNGADEALKNSINMSFSSFICLGLTGSLGAVFSFIILTRYGAVPTSIVGTVRKALIVSLSIIIFGHSLSTIQKVSLVLIACGLCVNLSKLSRTTTEVMPNVQLDTIEALTNDKISLEKNEANEEETEGFLYPIRLEPVYMCTSIRRLLRNFLNLAKCQKINYMPRKPYMDV